MNPRHPVLLLLLASAVIAHAQTPSKNTASLPPLPKPELTEQWEPVPPTVTADPGAAPSDAIVLFDGSNFDAWESTSKDPGKRAVRWTLEPESRAMVVAPRAGAIRTKASFGDVQLHAEWRSPAAVDPKKTGQGRGNSGIFFMGAYELQVLDSHNNPTYPNGLAGSIYKQFPPLVNASRAPGEWQTYDAVFITPRFNADGTLAAPAHVTVFHNGVLVQHAVALRGPTEYRGLPAYRAHAGKLPIELQDHGNPVAFRNIWVRELSFPPPPPVPNLPPPPYAPDAKK